MEFVFSSFSPSKSGAFGPLPLILSQRKLDFEQLIMLRRKELLIQIFERKKNQWSQMVTVKLNGKINKILKKYSVKEMKNPEIYEFVFISFLEEIKKRFFFIIFFIHKKMKGIE